MGEPVMDESSLKLALKTLDSRCSGYVEYDEFVDWWVGLCVPGRIEATKD